MDFSTPAKHMPSNPKKPLTLKEALSSVADFRIDRRKKYPLYEILMITVCAMIDGARGPTDFWRFGRGKIGFLRKFLPLVNGIPSHDTFRRVLGKLDTKRFNAAVVRWIQSVADISGDFVSIDGKLLRRALTKDGKMPCIVSAYSNNRKLVIGQIKADEKSNEITAIPDLLDLLYIKGAIVSIDAAGCQKKIVRKIIRQDGGYVISHKGNQTKMHDEIYMFMQDHGQGPLGVASPRSALVLSSQYSAVSVSKELNRPLHWLLVVGCWLLKHFGRRPIAEASA